MIFCVEKCRVGKILNKAKSANHANEILSENLLKNEKKNLSDVNRLSNPGQLNNH